MNKPTATLPTALTCYLMMRTDLPSLGRGKGYAQAMHAGNQLTNQLLVEPLMAGEAIDETIRAWHAEGEGFGTTIALGKEGEITFATLEQVVHGAKSLGMPADFVTDETYPYYVDAEIVKLIHYDVHTKEPTPAGKGFICYRREVTCGWAIGDKSAMSLIMSRFGLAPND